MAASSKQKKSSFDQEQFRKKVLDYYGALDVQGEDSAAYCHLTGWWDKGSVKASHLVPKSLSGEEISFLFDIGELVLSDPRNGKP